MAGMPIRWCSRHLRTLPTSLWVGNAGAIAAMDGRHALDAIAGMDSLHALNAGAITGDKDQ
jgi:hypothetical protein